MAEHTEGPWQAINEHDPYEIIGGIDGPDARQNLQAVPEVQSRVAYGFGAVHQNGSLC